VLVVEVSTTIKARVAANMSPYLTSMVVLGATSAPRVFLEMSSAEEYREMKELVLEQTK